MAATKKTSQTQHIIEIIAAPNDAPYSEAANWKNDFYLNGLARQNLNARSPGVNGGSDNERFDSIPSNRSKHKTDHKISS
jgi:hypothetical protein